MTSHKRTSAVPGYVDFETLYPTPDIRSPTLLAECAKAAKAMGELRPWTLVQLPGEPMLVAAKPSLWWRMVTWWRNRGRHAERNRLVKAMVERYAELDRRRAMGIPLDDGSKP